MLSEKARKNKIAYNNKRQKELYLPFKAMLLKEEYNEICEYLKLNGMNKAEFIRWAYEKLRSED